MLSEHGDIYHAQTSEHILQTNMIHTVIDIMMVLWKYLWHPKKWKYYDIQAVDLIRDIRFQPVVLGILYHLSIEDGHKSLFTYTDAIPIILDMLMSVNDLRQAPELIALAVNLTQNQRNAEVMVPKKFSFMLTVWEFLYLFSHQKTPITVIGSLCF